LVAWSGDALTEAAMDQFELDTSKSLQIGVEITTKIRA
jgi:hypothetical protein